MKKQYFTVLFALVCMLGFGLEARAQEEDTVVANVPYDFVVGSQVLPAGTYAVSRVEVTTGSRDLKIVSYQTGASALFIPTVFDDVQIGHAQLSFEHAGDRYFLSGIETPIGTYSIAVPRSAITLARMEQHSSSASGSN
jgi:hypothetical protein